MEVEEFISYRSFERRSPVLVQQPRGALRDRPGEFLFLELPKKNGESERIE